MTNPFEDPTSTYLVLSNSEGQYSLWPASIKIPDGWTIVTGPKSWQDCLDVVEASWTDMRPKSILGQRECPVKYPFREYVALDMDQIYSNLHKQQEMLRVRPPYGDDAWLAASYEAVKFVINDPRFSRNVTKYDEARLTPLPIRTSILGMDPPDHTRLRKALFAVINAQRAEKMKPWIIGVAHQLIDDFIEQGAPVDLIGQFVLPLTGRVLCELMDIPIEHRIQFKTWVDGFSSTSSLPQSEIELRMNKMYTYITDLIAQRREAPGNDIISNLLLPEDEHLQLSEIEVIDLVTVLLLAGYDSTGMEIANSIFVLLTHPKQADILLEQMDLMPQALQELLRYIPLDSHVAFARYATEDVDVCGTTVRDGDAILPSFTSANRDAAVFENPNTFDIKRVRKPHFGFGAGIHSCPGMSLALVLMEVALSALLTRLPTLRLTISEDDLEWLPGTLLRSLAKLPVEW